jgi:hypothetical protein
MPNETRSIRGGGDVYDTADDPVCRDRLADSTARIDSPQLLPGERAFGPLKNHQGTPFIAVTTAVSAPTSGPIRCAISGNEGAFTTMIT